MLTIEEKIARSERFAKLCGQAEIPEWQEECEQLVAWLRELAERRKEPEIIFCHECIHFQCNIRFDGSIPKGADEYECRHWCGGCDPMDYCSYGERAERKTDENNNVYV